MSNEFDRRDLIKIAAGAVVAAKFANPSAPAPRFFTSDEYAVVDDLSEILIPTDESAGGAKEAKVVDYIDQFLAETFEQEERDDFRSGLKLFMDTPATEREALLKTASLDAENPKTPEGKFFQLLKHHTVRGYYTSKIGIQSMDYKGNVYQTGVYAGILPS